MKPAWSRVIRRRACALRAPDIRSQVPPPPDFDAFRAPRLILISLFAATFVFAANPANLFPAADVAFNEDCFVQTAGFHARLAQEAPAESARFATIAHQELRHTVSVFTFENRLYAWEPTYGVLDLRMNADAFGQPMVEGEVLEEYLRRARDDYEAGGAGAAAQQPASVPLDDEAAYVAALAATLPAGTDVTVQKVATPEGEHTVLVVRSLDRLGVYVPAIGTGSVVVREEPADRREAVVSAIATRMVQEKAVASSATSGSGRRARGLGARLGSACLRWAVSAIRRR